MKISICIPTYNQSAYIESAVRSAFVQTLAPFEIIVSDDCSTDSTTEILYQLAKEIPFLKIIRQPRNLGIAGNVDSCLRSASGDFIIRLDSDDQLLPAYTEKLLELFARFPESGYAHAAVQEIDQAGKFLKQRKLIRDSGFQSSHEALKGASKGYRVAANIIMFKKDALIEVDFLKGRPDFGEDYHLTTSISAAGYGNIYSSEILSFYRVWVDAGKVRQKRKLSEIDGIQRVFEDVIQPAYVKLGWDLKEIEKSKTSFACHHADCLSWDIYNAKEKEELASKLFRLSFTPKTRFFAWAYLNGLGKIISVYLKLLAVPKLILKPLVLKFRSFNLNAR